MPSIVVLVVAAVAGAALGWWLRGRQDGRWRRAVEADWAERVRAVERARDRHRDEAATSQAALARTRDEHGRCGSRIQGFERKLRRARNAHAACAPRIQELEARVRELEGQLAEAEVGRAALPAVADLDRDTLTH